MTDEEKEKWLVDNRISGEMQFRMAEGNPASEIGGTEGGPLIIQVSKEIAEKHNVPNSESINDSEGQAPLQSS